MCLDVDIVSLQHQRLEGGIATLRIERLADDCGQGAREQAVRPGRRACAPFLRDAQDLDGEGQGRLRTARPRRLAARWQGRHAVAAWRGTDRRQEEGVELVQRRRAAEGGDEGRSQYPRGGARATRRPAWAAA